MAPAAKVPLLDHKLQQIVEAEDLIEGTHDHKATVEIFETFPKEELFSAPVEELRRSVIGLVQLRESKNVRLFVRRDLFNRSVAIVVALPRDRFNAPLRKQLQQLFLDRYNGTSVDYHLALGETDPAQIYFTVWVTEGEIPEVPFLQLEQEVVAMTRTWQDRVTDELTARVGEQEAKRMAGHLGLPIPRLLPAHRCSSALPQATSSSSTSKYRIRRRARHRPAERGRRARTVTRSPGLPSIGARDKMPLSGFMPHLVALGLTHRRRGPDPAQRR